MKKGFVFLVLILLLTGCLQKRLPSFDKEKGYFEIRNENGMHQLIKFYSEEGEVNGGVISFTANGNIGSFTYLKNDTIIIGPSVIYYDNGSMNYFDSFIDGVQEGVSVHYSPKGILTRKNYYRNGVKDGEQYTFHYDTGDTLKVEIYDKGKLIETIGDSNDAD